MRRTADQFGNHQNEIGETKRVRSALNDIGEIKRDARSPRISDRTMGRRGVGSASTTSVSTARPDARGACAVAPSSREPRETTLPVDEPTEMFFFDPETTTDATNG
jgi:hypothetical protein